MRNETFPTYQQLIDHLKAFMHKSKPYYMEDDKCKTNLLGELLDAGYDVLVDLPINDDFTFTLVVRVASGFMPIQLLINPDTKNIIKTKLDRFYEIIQNYKDIPVGFFMTLVRVDNQNITLDEKAKYQIKEVGDLYWWGGSLFKSAENVEQELLPIWQRKKLSMYNLRKNVEGQQ